MNGDANEKFSNGQRIKQQRKFFFSLFWLYFSPVKMHQKLLDKKLRAAGQVDG
jgi:hypothetical protein